MEHDIEQIVKSVLGASIVDIQDAIAPKPVRGLLGLLCSHRNVDDRLRVCLECGMTAKELVIRRGAERVN